MGDFSAGTQGLKLSDVKSELRMQLELMQKWQRDQRQEFQKKQLLEHKSLFMQSEDKFKDLYEKHSGLPINSRLSVNSNDPSLSGSEVSFQDQTSSINGHMLNCFSDSSHDSTHFFKNKDIVGSPLAPVSNGGYSSLSDIASQKLSVAENYSNGTNEVPRKKAVSKRPFLKKGAGLARFQPKQKTNFSEASTSSLEQKTDCVSAPKILKLKPTIHCSSSPPRKTNHVKFCEPVQTSDYQSASSESQSPLPPKEISHIINIPTDLENFSVTETQKSDDKSSSCDISQNSESKELEEFEHLENCAQNSSFNSDSSVVQRVLYGEPLKSIYGKPLSNKSSIISNSSYEWPIKKTQDKNENYTNNAKLKELESRQQHFQDYLSIVEKDVKRCSTPVEETSLISDSNSSQNTSTNSIIFVPQNDNEESDAENVDNYRMTTNSSAKKQKEDIVEIPAEKSKLKEKMEELENEIKKYQAERAQLTTISKERDLILKDLKKEQDSFSKYKEEEIKKIESQRQQLKREKDTVNRLKKATLDHKNRREREDLSTLKKEVEKLQRELKKEKIKFNNETRKLKNQLIAAENDRDDLKLKNLTLEDQVEDLVTSLKRTLSQEEKSQAKVQSKADKIKKASICLKESSNFVADNSPADVYKEIYINVEDNIDDSNTRTKVRFNLVPPINENIPNTFLSESDTNENYSNSHDSDLMIDSTVDSGKDKPLYEEIVHDDRIEKMYHSGEVETFYTSGNRRGDRKHISACGDLTTHFYSNGDTKEIFLDKSTTYKFKNGDVQKTFPSGLVVTTLFDSGQVHKLLPDGTKEVTFPDGMVHYFYCDGSEKIVTKDKTEAYIDLDGAKTYKYANGMTEIHKDGNIRKEYPDGAMKTIYKSGKVEVRYANGRIKIKDKDGDIIMDTKHLKGFTDKFG